MFVTDIAHVGKYEVIEVSKNEIKLKRISSRHVVAETDKENLITILPISLFEISFVEVENINVAVNEIESAIGDTFSLKQKVIIALVLAKLTQSKGYTDITEKATLTYMVKNELRIDLGDENVKLLSDELRPLPLTDLMKGLAYSTSQQKEFIVVLGYKLMKSKGLIHKLESVCMNKITNELAVSVSNINAILEKHGYMQNESSVKSKEYSNSGCMVLFVISITISSLILIL